MHLESYINKLLDLYRMTDCNTSADSVHRHTRGTVAVEELGRKLSVCCASAAPAVKYAMTATVCSLLRGMGTKDPTSTSVLSSS